MSDAIQNGSRSLPRERGHLLANHLQKVLPESLSNCRAPPLSHQGALQKAPGEADRASSAPVGCGETSEPVAAGPADKQLLQIGEVRVKRRAADARAMHDIADRHRVVTPLQDQRNECLVEPLTRPLDAPVVLVGSPHQALFLEKQTGLSRIGPAPLAFRRRLQIMDIISITERPVDSIESALVREAITKGLNQAPQIVAVRRPMEVHP